MPKTAVVVLNWNGKESIEDCLDSLLAQTFKAQIILIDNGSVDGSLEIIQKKYPDIDLIINQKNLGFAGGVNQGIERAIELNLDYVALFNDDAVADQHWLAHLVGSLDKNHEVGIATCKFMTIDRKKLDSTGDLYTSWGLPFPRGRDEEVSTKYDDSTEVFGASGGASIYRIKMLSEIGLFDNDFFAYYEDIDISFRAQLAGWKVRYVFEAMAYHQIGASSSKIKGFTTYQTMKNLPWIIVKDVPFSLWPTMLPRFSLAYFGFMFSSFLRGHGQYALKGFFVSLALLPKKLVQRHRILGSRKVTTNYINSILLHDLPANAKELRNLRSKWWKLTGKSS
ncbi:MAG TPA: glycosyltransferase family 2 protein [Candidatus Saccharimonadales bacterium]